jgi:hypothetical protein
VFRKSVEIGKQDLRDRAAQNNVHGEVVINFIEKNAFGVKSCTLMF